MFSIVGSICVGDKTSCGRTVVTGDWTSDVNGRVTARVGDMIDCKYGCTIATGDPTWIIAGKPIALHGSSTTGGCICLSSNNNYHGAGQSAEQQDAVPKVADAGVAYMPETAALLSEDNWLEIRLADKEDKPFRGLKYIVTDPSGKRFDGHLDETGYARIEPVKAGYCKVEFPEIGYTSTVESCQQ